MFYGGKNQRPGLNDRVRGEYNLYKEVKEGFMEKT
jgi:hypothetical protein